MIKTLINLLKEDILNVNSNIMITVKAIFIGQNKSLGYETNKEYLINIITHEGVFFSIERTNGDGHCPYSSIITFLRNWDNIIVVA